jgi:hypothetical protein
MAKTPTLTTAAEQLDDDVVDRDDGHDLDEDGRERLYAALDAGGASFR